MMHKGCAKMEENMSELPKRRERVALWDNLKFVLILLVVIGHFVDCYIEAPAFQSIFAFIYAVCQAGQ